MTIKCAVCGSEFQRKPNYFRKFPPPYRCSHRCRHEIGRRFWDKVDKSGECWIYQGKLNHASYGRITVNGKEVMAHRVAWEIHNHAKIPDGMIVCHKCDNPPCVNPSHLFIGTNDDNVQDCVKKGRNSKGENHTHKLTEKQVIEIRKLYATGQYRNMDLAKMFNVATMTINRAVRWLTWRHVPHAT